MTDWHPAPYTATATVRRGTFEAELYCDGSTPAEAFDVLNGLIRRMRLKATRKAHPRPVVTVGLHSRVDVLPDADAYREQDAAHREQLATHAHGLAYALVPGTPELFGEAEPTPAPQPESVAVSDSDTPAPRRASRPRRSRFNGAAQAAAFSLPGGC